jgi:hypothetical protein
MEYAVEYTNEFADWWEELSSTQQDDVNVSVELLMNRGVNLKFPHSSGINGSRHFHMRELIVQSAGNPLRVFYAFVGEASLKRESSPMRYFAYRWRQNW